MRPTWDEYFLAIAKTVSLRSTCSRRQVGAVVVNQSQVIIGTGYNGAPRDMPHCVDGGCPRGVLNKVKPDSDYDTPGSPGFCVAAHAEANALLHAHQPVKGAVVYVTDMPCPGCVKLLAAAEVAAVVWGSPEAWDEDRPWDLLFDFAGGE